MEESTSIKDGDISACRGDHEVSKMQLGGPSVQASCPLCMRRMSPWAGGSQAAHAPRRSSLLNRLGVLTDAGGEGEAWAVVLALLLLRLPGLPASGVSSAATNERAGQTCKH